MNFRKTLLGATVALGLVASGYAVGQINANRHPNLASAQRYCEQASGALHAAQRANEFDMAGHAARADGLLKDAYREIKMAAETSNRR